MATEHFGCELNYGLWNDSLFDSKPSLVQQTVLPPFVRRNTGSWFNFLIPFKILDQVASSLTYPNQQNHKNASNCQFTCTLPKLGTILN